MKSGSIPAPIIVPITSVTQALSNPRAGDWIFIDIDKVILFVGERKYQDPVRLTEKGVAAAIRFLQSWDARQERNVKVIGITARREKYKQATIDQLRSANIQLDEIIHAPNKKQNGDEKKPTKGSAISVRIEGLNEKEKPTRIVVVDDKQEQLDNIASCFKESNIPIVLYHYQRSMLQATCLKVGSERKFPNSLKGFTVDRSLGGGTESTYLITNPSQPGQKLVLKFGAHGDASKLEILCNAAYQVLGVNVPDFAIYNTLPTAIRKYFRDNESKQKDMKYGFFSVSEFVQPGEIEKSKREELITQAARDHFGAHALLGNIDVAKEDNFIVTESGEVILIDAGANYIFRSLGKQRKEPAHLLKELKSLRSNDINKKAYKWFGDLDEGEIKSQVITLATKQRMLEQVLWDVAGKIGIDSILFEKFVNGLADRFDVSMTKYCPENIKHAYREKRAVEKRTAAGIFTYAWHDNRWQMLVAKRVRHKYFDSLGGKSEKGDHSLKKTAIREVYEESNFELKYGESELINAPFHDLISKKNGQPFTYRMYIAQHAWVDPEEMEGNEDVTEHDKYRWVPIEKVLMKNGKIDDDIEFYPPFLEILQQQPVQDNLRHLLATGVLRATATSSYQSMPTVVIARQSKYVKGSGLENPNYQPPQSSNSVVSVTVAAKQMAQSFLPKSKMLDQFKQTRMATQRVASPLRGEVLSQSELHMRALLGDDFKPNDVKANVEKILEMHFSVDEEYKDTLISACTDLIENERKDDCKLFLNHATNDQGRLLYDLYTLIYQRLHADSRWAAFRMSGFHLMRFDNIAKFIAHYMDENGVIDNNKGEFHHCAISTNPFVFSNHGHPTSCSINYLLDNRTSRDFNLKDLLDYYLKPFLVDRSNIKKLKKIYETFLKGTGGVLYQIALDKTQVSEFVYPAGSLGVLNEYQGERNLNTILEKLSAIELPYSKEDLDYISRLQARLLSTPSLPLSVQKVSLKPIPRESEYQAELAKCADQMVQLLLASMNGANATPFYQDAPLVARFLEQKEAIGLAPLDEVEPAYLTLAIMTENHDMVRAIFAKQPKLKELTFSVKAHLKELHLEESVHLSVEADVPTSYRELMLANLYEDEDSDDEDNDEKNDNQLRLIAEIYGAKWWLDAMVNAEEFLDACAYIKWVPEEEKKFAVAKLLKKVNSSNELIIVFKLIPQNTWLDFIKKNTDSISSKNMLTPKFFKFISQVDRYHPYHSSLALCLLSLEKYRTPKKVLALFNCLQDPMKPVVASSELELIRLFTATDKRKLITLMSTDDRASFAKRLLPVNYSFEDVISFLTACGYVKFNRYDRYTCTDFDFPMSMINECKKTITSLNDFNNALSWPGSIQEKLKLLESNTFIKDFNDILKVMDVLKPHWHGEHGGFVYSNFFRMCINELGTANKLNQFISKLPISLQAACVCKIDKNKLLALVADSNDIMDAMRSCSPDAKNAYFSSLGISLNASLASKDFTLAQGKLKFPITPSNYVGLQLAGDEVSHIFFLAQDGGHCSEQELSNMAKVLNKVSATISDPLQLQDLLKTLQACPITVGEKRLHRMVLGALAVFIGVALVALAVTVAVFSFGAAAPITIGAVTLGVNMIVGGVAIGVAAVGAGGAVAGGFFAASGRKQGPALEVDRFVREAHIRTG